MAIKIEEISFDELFDRIKDEFSAIFEEEKKVPEVKYDHKENKCKHNEKVCELEGCLDRQQKEYEELRKLYLRTKDELVIAKKDIASLLVQNEKLVEAGKKISENGHAIVEKQTGINKIISDKVSSDGYKIVNDIKVWTEFARKAGKIESTAFVDMLDMIRNAINSVPDYRKKVSC